MFLSSNLARGFYPLVHRQSSQRAQLVQYEPSVIPLQASMSQFCVSVVNVTFNGSGVLQKQRETLSGGGSLQSGSYTGSHGKHSTHNNIVLLCVERRHNKSICLIHS